MKQTRCSDIKKIMIDYLSGERIEFPAQSGQSAQPTEMQEHVQTCSRCSSEYRVLQGIFHESRRVDDAAEAAMATIDWDENAEAVTRAVRFKESRRRTRPAWGFSVPTMNFNWKLAVPTMAAVFILGISIGYLLFYNAPQTPVLNGRISKTDAALARLETTLTKKEVHGYLQQTQMLFTDLMRQCDEDGSAAWATGVNRRRVRTLLNKNRYFNQDPSNPELLSTRRLLKKIEWLLYEMTTLDEKSSCQQLERLQDFIRRERLLLIREGIPS